MTRTEFFEAIKSDCKTQKEYLIALLELRGFLVDRTGDNIVLSDNSHKDDESYLNRLLTKYQFGYVNNGIVTIDEDINASLFENEFLENKSITGEVCINATDWKWFRRRKHGEKAPVECLEPFIARYVKAISACCVLTVGSCDGNHPGRDMMFLQLSGKGSVPWHRMICKHLIKNISWMNDYTAIGFTPHTKYKTYYELNNAAKLIYDNRITLREVKENALREMSGSYLRKRTSEEIELEFVNRVSMLLNKK